MSPRNSAVAAAATRTRIVEQAMRQASIEGLSGLTLGVLAQDLGLSKAGVVGPFGSKEGLQLAALQRAIELFRQEVWGPVAHLTPGAERLRAACEAWIVYHERRRMPGGCFLTSAAAEWDSRRGPLRDATAAALDLWLGQLQRDAERAKAAGELSPDTDTVQLVFELNGVAMSLNQRLLLYEDAHAPQIARRAISRLLQTP